MRPSYQIATKLDLFRAVPSSPTIPTTADHSPSSPISSLRAAGSLRRPARPQ